MLTLTTKQLKGIIKVGDYVSYNNNFCLITHVTDKKFVYQSYDDPYEEMYKEIYFDKRAETMVNFISSEAMQLALAKSLELVAINALKLQMAEEKE